MKQYRGLTAALCIAAFLCALGPAAHAEPGEEYGEEAGSPALWEGVEPAEPLPVATIGRNENAFTPAGTGTVVDNATGEDDKEFFTITTASEEVFYLVIDRQRGNENVYFLNAVTVADLLALAEDTGEPIAQVGPQEMEPAPAETPPFEPAPAENEKTPTGGARLGLFLPALAVVLVGGGTAIYFKVYRPKRQRAADAEEEYGEAPEPHEEDFGPPWDDEEADE